MPVSGNYQFNFGGYDFGGLQAGVQVLEVDGLESEPSLRTQDDSGGYRDGQFSGRDFLNGRYVTMQLQVMNDSANSMQTYLAALKSAFTYQQTGTTPLQFQLPGRNAQQVNARVRRRDIKIDPDYVYGRAIATVELFCPDPRVYDANPINVVLTPGSGLGRTYDRTYNLIYNTTTGSQAYVTLTNTGNITVYPEITITGGITNPRIVNQTTGDYILLDITTASTDVITIDPDLRLITLNGDPARNLLAAGSTWFGLPPGATTIGIVADYNATGICTFAYRNGYV